MTRDRGMMQETAEALARKHPDLAAFHCLKNGLQRNPLTAMLRHRANIDMAFRMLARRIFTNRGIQGVSLSAAVLNLTQLAADRATATINATRFRLAGIRLGRNSKVRGSLRSQGNRRNLVIGDHVIFEGDAEFILPRGVNQGCIVIGDDCVVAHGALFHCIAGELIIGSSCYVGRNVILQSNGDLRIGAYTLIAANAGLYASNHVSSDKSTPIWTQGNKFVGISIGLDCWIGHGAVITDGATLGDKCFVGPNQVVRGVYKSGSRLK